MRRLSSWLALAASLSCLAGPVRLAHADSNPVITDEKWIAPDFAQRAPHRIAVLPAVSYNAVLPEHLASTLVPEVFANDGRTWLTPSLCRLLFGSELRDRDSVLRLVNAQVLRSGHTDSTTTRAIARRLRADAILLLRVERWEHTATPSEAISIELRGELIDSTGAPLLRLLSRSRAFGQPLHNDLDLSTPPLVSRESDPASTGNTGTPAPGASGKRRPLQIADADVPFEPALTALLEAWKAVVPAAGPPAAAGH